MDKRSGRRLLFSFLLTFTITGLLAVLLSSSLISTFLSKTEKVDADILLVEGWLPDYALENAKNEFRNNSYKCIVTTGNVIPENFYIIYGSGYMTFYVKDLITGTADIKQHTIEVDAYSELDGENSAHFEFFLNDSLMEDFYADKKERKYGVIWKGDIGKIDSVMIHFDNDKWGDWGDRNLFVKEIIIDNKIHFPYFFNSRYDYLDLDGKDIILFRYKSYAELAKNKLLRIGVDSSSVVAVPGEKTSINRTLTSAKAFRKWLNKSNLNVKGINIVSLSTHARRTWMVYKRVLGEPYKIGIISVMDSKKDESAKDNILTSLREILGIVYYWFALIPYYFF